MIDICPRTLSDLRSKQFSKNGAQENRGTPPAWDAGPLQGYPSLKFTGTYLYTWALWELSVSPKTGQKEKVQLLSAQCTNYEAATPGHIKL